MTDFEDPSQLPDRVYDRGELHRRDLPDQPGSLFDSWFQAAIDTPEIVEPHAMALATADVAGIPHVRMVLLKGHDERGFRFFTNYDSHKGRQLSANPVAALTFWWPTLERQVRIEGSVERVSEAESDAYFASRSRGSQLASAASPQSQTVANRETLEALMRDLDRASAEQAVARPAHWGGFRVAPTTIEFWQGRPGRAHDRFRYQRVGAGWQLDRLAP